MLLAGCWNVLGQSNGLQASGALPNTATELQFDIFPGYGDVVKRQSWIPLTFREITMKWKVSLESSKSTRLADRSSTPCLLSCLKGLAKEFRFPFSRRQQFHLGYPSLSRIGGPSCRTKSVSKRGNQPSWLYAGIGQRILCRTANCPIRPRLKTAPSCQRLDGSWLKTYRIMPLPMRVWTPSICMRHKARSWNQASGRLCVAGFILAAT